MPVDTKRKDFVDVEGKWQRLRDCYEGRDAVLKAGEKYVPSLPAKDAEENAAYRKRGNFYNAVQRTTNGMTGAVFQDAPEVEFPEAIKTYLDDVTLTNIPFEMFAQETGREVVLMSRYGVMIDMPALPPLGVPLTDVRPYLVGYKAEDIINWRTERIGGRQVLTYLVLREMEESIDPKDPFVCVTTCQYRVVYLINNTCNVQLYREKAPNEKEYVPYGPVMTPTRRGVALDFIPFVFICAMNATPDIEIPPLIDLADVNLGHWRNSVDYEYGLHLVALPTPWVAGAKNSGDGKTPMKMGPSVVWELDIQGQAGMLEFQGAGLAAIVTSMEEKKKQMAVLGGRLLEDPSQVQETASAVRMRHVSEHASLRMITQSLEVGLTLVLQIMVWWDGTIAKPADAECSVELNKDFLNIKATAQEITAALQALQAGQISFDTWYSFLQTGGWAREGVDADAEQKEIDDEAIEAKKKNPEPVVTPPGPTKKTITGPDGKVKYQITEEQTPPAAVAS
jgi:hypothetical protein